MWGGIPTPHRPCSYYYSPYHMLEIVLLLDNFLIILMSIGMTLTLIPITWHGATSLISRGKLKLLKIMLHNFMNCTIKHIPSSMINHIPHTILHSSSLRQHHLLYQILMFKLRC